MNIKMGIFCLSLVFFTAQSYAVLIPEDDDSQKLDGASVKLSLTTGTMPYDQKSYSASWSFKRGSTNIISDGIDDPKEAVRVIFGGRSTTSLGSRSLQENVTFFFSVYPVGQTVQSSQLLFSPDAILTLSRQDNF